MSNIYNRKDLDAMQKGEKMLQTMPKVGDKIETPRFLTVQIAETFDSVTEAYNAGFKEPTHYMGEFKILGKSIDTNRMVFATAPNE